MDLPLTDVALYTTYYMDLPLTDVSLYTTYHTDLPLTDVSVDPNDMSYIETHQSVVDPITHISC
jgi:hypothetical protein